MGEKQLTMEELKELLKAEVKAAVEPLTKVDRKFGAFPGLTKEEIDKMKYEEKIVKFFRSMVQGNVAEAKALSEGVDTGGGFLVPGEFHGEVIRLVETYGIARRMCRMVPMKRDEIRFPKLITGVGIYWPGEKGKGTESTPAFGQVSLLAKKAIGILSSSNELLEDADIDVVGFFQILFAEALAAEEDYQLFQGTGAPFVGILNHPDVIVKQMGSGDTTFSKVDANDLLDLIDAVSDAAEVDAGFYFHKNILTHLRKLKDSNGQYIWDRPGAGQPGAIWGEPYEKSPKMPSTSDSGAEKKFLIYGNLKQVYFGDRKEMTIAIADQATVGANNTFEQDMRALRVTERVSIQVAQGNALSVLKTAAAS